MATITFKNIYKPVNHLDLFTGIIFYGKNEIKDAFLRKIQHKNDLHGYKKP